MVFADSYMNSFYFNILSSSFFRVERVVTEPVKAGTGDKSVEASKYDSIFLFCMGADKLFKLWEILQC